MINTRRRAQIAACVVVILLIFFMFLIWFFTREKTVNQEVFESYDLPGNSKQTRVYVNNDTSVFSNGRALIEYNLSTGETKKLTNTSELPPIISIEPSPNNNFIAFQTQYIKKDAFSGEEFLGDLPKPEIESEIPAWWILDKSSGNITFALRSPEKIIWESDTSFVFSSLETLDIYDITSGTFRQLVRADSARKFAVYGDWVYYLDSSSEIKKVNKKDLKTETVHKPASSVTFSGKEGCMLVTESGEEGDDSTAKIMGCGKDKNIDEGLVGTAIFDESSKFLFFSKANEVRKLDIEKDKLVILSEFNPDLLDIELIKAFDEKILIYRDSYGFHITNRSIGFKPFESSNPATVRDFVVDFLPDERSILASKTSNYTPEDKAAVELLVKEKFGNSDLYYIEFSVLPEDNRFNP